MMQAVRRATPAATITSDASGNWGCGAFSGQSWFQLKWVEQLLGHSITIKELIPIVVAAAIWGHKWRGSTVQILWVRSERRVRCYKVQQVDLESILKQVQILVSMEGSVMKFIIREGAVVVMKKIPGSDFYFLSWKLHELNYRLQSDYSTVLKFANI